MPAGIRIATTRVQLKALAALTLLGLLAACASRQSGSGYGAYYGGPRRYYPPPGPSDDPWGPYVREAAGRFRIPERWIREVMRQELAGREDAYSSAGAMGLMQVMPQTYAILRARYGLGDDPFEPHDNVMAGAAYIREMYERYGSPGFLAAYNAGPNRLDSYLSDGTSLPEETVGYVAAIAPRLGNDAPLSGPLSVFAGGGATQYAASGPANPVYAASYAAPSPGACDPDAAYDPSRPCAPVAAPVPVPEAAPAPVTAALVTCDPDAAYDPDRPCAPAPVPAGPTLVATSLPAPVRREPAPTPFVPSPVPAPAPYYAAAPAEAPSSARYDPNRGYAVAQLPGSPRGSRWRLISVAAAEPVLPRMQPASGTWAVQVGAFASAAMARAATESARAAVPGLLRTARAGLTTTTSSGAGVLYRARLSDISCRRGGSRLREACAAADRLHRGAAGALARAAVGVPLCSVS